MQQINMNLPSGATDTRRLVEQLNRMVRDDQPQSEVVETAVQGLIGIVGTLEGALRELDDRMSKTRKMMGRM